MARNFGNDMKELIRILRTYPAHYISIFKTIFLIILLVLLYHHQTKNIVL